MTLPRSKSFEDVYKMIFRVTNELLADRLDAQKAMAFAANMKVMNDFINTEIKISQIEISTGKSLPLLGGRVIATNNDDVESDVIENDVISNDSKLAISSISIPGNKPERTRKPCLGFIGLTPGQAGEISETFSELADLKFWMDDGMPKLKTIAACDVVFSTNRVAHKTTEYLAANGLNLSKQFVKITGSVSAMKYAVKSFFENADKS